MGIVSASGTVFCRYFPAAMLRCCESFFFDSTHAAASSARTHHIIDGTLVIR